MTLAGHTALITGASGYLGRHLAVAFARAGATVVLTARSNLQSIREVQREVAGIGGRAETLLMDLAAPMSIRDGIDEISRRMELPDMLINNAVMRSQREFERIEIEEWDLIHAVNLRAPFQLAQALIPAMRLKRFGRVINISGLDAFWSISHSPHVTVSKWGIIGLTQALASECADAGVTVNAIAPGVIGGERGDSTSAAPFRGSSSLIDRIVAHVPMGRSAMPAEICHAALFLASEEASYITGTTLMLTGGAHPMVRL